MNKQSKGFTLVELLVVIGILGILMGALFPAISAMQVFRSFRSVTVCAAVFSVCGALAGMIISILQGWTGIPLVLDTVSPA